MDTSYKLSKYNYIFDLEKKKFVYNSLFGSLIEMQPGLWNKISNNEVIETELQSKLRKLGVIIEHDYEEIQELKDAFYRSKYTNKVANFIVYLTLKCNFNCYYCFEEEKKVAINEKDVKSLDNFISSIIPSLDKLTIRWSGGEPLLEWDKIKTLSACFIELCNDKKVNYSASMATNGYLLNEEVIKELRDCKINDLTITLDGPPSWHNKVRNTNSESSFARIIENIKMACHYTKVIIRVNFDKRNITFFEELLIELDKQNLPKDKITLYFKPILGIKRADSKLFTNDEFYQEEIKLIGLTQKYRFKISFHPGFNTGLRCMYYHTSSFAVDPQLNLYKCPEFIGLKEHAIGHIESERASATICHNEILKANAFTPFEINECLNCSVLPLCSGKCPVLYKQNGCEKNVGCISEKDTLIEKLKYSIKQKEQLGELNSEIY